MLVIAPLVLIACLEAGVNGKIIYNSQLVCYLHNAATITTQSSKREIATTYGYAGDIIITTTRETSQPVI